MDNIEEKSAVKLLLKEYEHEIIKSTFVAFGLDMLLVKDQYGGDVDTIHNVRQIEGDKFGNVSPASKMQYKNKENERFKIQEGEYNSNLYHGNKAYIQKNREGSIKRENGQLVDEYTGKKLGQKNKVDLDHVIAAKSIHYDRGRALAQVDGPTIANQDSNLKHTNENLNRSKKVKNMEDFIVGLKNNYQTNKLKYEELEKKPNLTDVERKEMRKLQNLLDADYKKMEKIDKQARQNYESQIARKYYASKKFAKDTTRAAHKKGLQIGLKQALGLIITELIITIRENSQELFNKIKQNFDFKEFISEFIKIIKISYEKIKVKFKKLLTEFMNGYLSGFMSSLVNTVINIFFTTSKRFAKVLTEIWSSIIECVNLLVFNPEKLLFGDLIKSVMKIISMASSVVIGTVVAEYISKNLTITPILEEIVPQFVGGIVSGFISVSLLFFIDHSSIMNRYFDFLNQIKTRNQHKIDYYNEINNELKIYAASLQKIDIDKFEEIGNAFKKLNEEYNDSMSNEMKGFILGKYIHERGIDFFYDGTINGLDNFMNNNNLELNFRL
ncbi:hypothetical protein ACMGE7_01950 [Macrococcus equi]|uniref:hypothetical protein n=1 Tax=Macrococcus equi TaxID=3395462 RepID=UPI0039BDB574